MMRNLIRKIIFRKPRNGVVVGYNVHKYADDILREVKNADNILLHCHPSPDPDSVCSALAMKFVLEGMGKKVTVIRGDNYIPRGFTHFPGSETIVDKNILEVDLKSFDLFVSVDSASIDQITKKMGLVFPDSLRVVNIDHHATNTKFGHVNMIEPNYPATSQVLYELFQEWRIKMSTDIATDLFMGIYTDTVEFRTPLTSPKTFLIASKLSEHISDVGKVIFEMENNETKEYVKFVGLMVNSVQSYLDERVAIASLPISVLDENGIRREDISSGHTIMAIMRSVKVWQILITMVEIAPNKIKVSTRSKDSDKYDVSKLAESLGGGGHKAAAGILMIMSLEDAKKMILSKARELFGL